MSKARPIFHFINLILIVVLMPIVGYYMLTDVGMIVLHAIDPLPGLGLLVWGCACLYLAARQAHRSLSIVLGHPMKPIDLKVAVAEDAPETLAHDTDPHLIMALAQIAWADPRIEKIRKKYRGAAAYVFCNQKGMYMFVIMADARDAKDYAARYELSLMHFYDGMFWRPSMWLEK